LYNVELLNARRLKNKIHELHFKLITPNSLLDIVCITETWLNSSQFIAKIELIFVKVEVCVLSNNASVRIVQLNFATKYHSLEFVVVDVLSREALAKSFRLFVAYRPPSSSDSDSASLAYTTLFCECIESLYPTNSTIVLCGDFNFPRINRLNNKKVLTNVKTCSGIFIEFFHKHALTQLLTYPSRFSEHCGNGYLLDLILCNDRNFVLNTSVDAPFCSSNQGTVAFNPTNTDPIYKR
jgi:hypothetical protein